MNTECADLVLDRPALATAVVAAVATVAYLAIQLVLDGAVAPVETAAFALIFTVVYVGGNWYLGRQAREAATE